MSKRAETVLKAYKTYPVVIEEYTERDLNKPRRLSYIKGYEQAEKDLALTWGDVNLIDSILIDMQDEGVERYGGLRQYYEEALKRFNEKKNE